MEELFAEEPDEADDRAVPGRARGAAALAVYLSEYQRIGNETNARFANQRLAFTVMIAAAAALVSFGDHLPNKPDVYYWIPLAVAPLGYIFFDNELMIWRLCAYVREHLHERLAALTQDDHVLRVDEQGFKHRLTRQMHFTLSIGRWVVFVAPLVASFAVMLAPLRLDRVHVALLVADTVVSVILLGGIVAAIREQATWRRILKDLSAAERPDSPHWTPKRRSAPDRRAAHERRSVPDRRRARIEHLAAERRSSATRRIAPERRNGGGRRTAADRRGNVRRLR